MKSLKIMGILGLVIVSIIIHSCKREEIPTVTTSAITEIKATSAVCGGTVADEGSGSVYERGVCWDIGEPSIVNNKATNGTGTGSFICNLTYLYPAMIYYVRAYATNSAGTGYGMVMSFKTMGQAPFASSQPATKITTVSATLNGVVNANYVSTTVTFEYGTTTSYGETISATQNPVMGDTNTNVTADISGLAPGTTYYFRLKTINSLGTTIAYTRTFTTLGHPPEVRFEYYGNVTSTSAILDASIVPNYLPTTVTIEYGTTLSYGSTIEVFPSPGIEVNTTISVKLSGLNPGTTYYWRVKAVNSLGTTYRDGHSFTTNFTGATTKIADADGNTYNIVTIGSQIWMVENLKTTKFNDGTSIPLVTDNTEWSALKTPGYCWYYNNEAKYKNEYGALYNWYSVDKGNLCPVGWHVSTDPEWTILTNSLGGPSIAGGKLKEAGTAHWGNSLQPPTNVGASNESGFTALPGGMRYYDGGMDQLGVTGYWWTSTEIDSQFAYGSGYIYCYSTSISRFGYDKRDGFSVRCVKNN